VNSHRAGRWAWRAAFALCCTAAVDSSAAAQSDRLYESQRAALAMNARSFSVDPQPEGKRIAFVAVAREDVFVDDELWPVWPNLFHWLTVEETIRRELLQRPGDRYASERIEETMRNLRELGIFALVRIVPVKTREPDTVGLLVYTRDLWSLRLETAFDGTFSSLERLTVQLTERNFLGRNKVLLARFLLEPKSFSLGEAYVDPRVYGGELRLTQSFDLIFERESGEVEGSQGKVTLGSPYRDLSQRWGWLASASYLRHVYRGLAGSEIATYREDDGRPLPCTPLDDPDEYDPDECLRSVYDDHQYAASVTGSYRRGDTYKQTFSLGAAFGQRDVQANEETALRPDQEETFARLLLPRERRQVYPFASYSLWLPDYVVFRNLSTFGKSENVRVGPVLAASVSLPLEAFGSSTNSVRFTGDVGYVLADGEALAEASVGTDARLEEDRVVDQMLAVVLRGATPQWLAGRLVLYASWTGRRRDTAQTQVTLGADDGLRGYEVNAWRGVGASRLRTNVEYRTLPLVFESIHLGGVLFYDAGSVYTALDDAELHHSAGAGLRLLFPQFNHTPFRLDFGVPLDAEGFEVVVSFGSDQAVPLTAADDAARTSTL
jgi:hypothetical protein